jgi:hypothetical protein
MTVSHAPREGDPVRKHTKTMSMRPYRRERGKYVRLFRSKIKAVAVAVSVVAALASFFVAGASNANAATPAVHPALTSCGAPPGSGYFHYYYVEANGSRSFDMWENGYNKDITLGKVSGSSYRDCFKLLGAFGEGRFELEAWQTAGCLSIKGPSTAQGAKVILYPCHSLKSELFTAAADGSHGIYFISSYSHKCLDLSNGWKSGSTVVQKACVWNDRWQGWNFQPLNG